MLGHPGEAPLLQLAGRRLRLAWYQQGLVSADLDGIYVNVVRTPPTQQPARRVS